MGGIDPRAVIEKGAELDAGVSAGPFCHIGPKVRIGAGTVVSAHAVIEGRTTIGRDNWIGPFAYIGGPPQHVSYKGEDTAVVIGDRNRIREQVTIHRGTAEGPGETRLGSDDFIMVGTHIAHDCMVGDRVITANLATLAGHVEVEDDAVFGGLTGVHQYVRIGRVAMIAAMSRISQDVPPYALVGGDPPRFLGLNRVGLKRVGMDEEAKKALRQAYRIIFSKGVKLADGLARAEQELGTIPEVSHVLEFIRGSKRGIIRE
jgi:UDP-N-acetylglucosamine acyltransferase